MERTISGFSMFRAVKLQFMALVLVTVLAGVIGNVEAAVSAMVGGLAIALPSLLFAMRLSSVKQRNASYAVDFFIGELVKLGSAIVILAAFAQVYSQLNWLGLIVGLLVTLQANFLALLVKT